MGFVVIENIELNIAKGIVFPILYVVHVKKVAKILPMHIPVQFELASFSFKRFTLSFHPLNAEFAMFCIGQWTLAD